MTSNLENKNYSRETVFYFWGLLGFQAEGFVSLGWGVVCWFEVWGLIFFNTWNKKIKSKNGLLKLFVNVPH